MRCARTFTSTAAWLACCLAAMTSGAAGAAPCQLIQLASFDDGGVGDGPPVISGHINGNPAALYVDTGAWTTTLFEQSVQRLHVATANNGEIASDSAGRHIELTAKIKIDFGGLHADKYPVLVGYPEPDAHDGLFGADILQRYDEEIDPLHKKIAFYITKTCPGHEVYWTNEYDDLDFQVDRSNHIVFRLTLDGVSLMALLDTGSSNSALMAPLAESQFNLTLGSPGTDKIDNVMGMQRYRHQFKTLAIGDVEFRNPVIDIVPDRQPPIPFAERSQAELRPTHHQFVLGMHEIRKLRLLISYGDRKLYVTTAAAANPNTAPANQNAQPR